MHQWLADTPLAQSHCPVTGFLCPACPSVPPLASHRRSGRGLGPTVTRLQSLPVAVVGGQWIGDVASGHQEESAPNMPGTADRKEDEGSPEADAPLVKQLQKEEDDSITRVFTAPLSTTSKQQKQTERPSADKRANALWQTDMTA